MRFYGTFILLTCSLLILGCATEINKIRLYEAPKPDARILSVVSNVMQAYQSGLEWENECVLEIDSNGIIETNWHPVQKGDVKRKIQIYVWGSIYRVDVWHNSTFGSLRGIKDYGSRLVEMNLQLEIEKKLSQPGDKMSLNWDRESSVKLDNPTRLSREPKLTLA